MNKIYNIVDLFAGIGGIRLGFEVLGRVQNVFSAEIDKAACETYKLNFNENPYCDVTNLTEEQISRIPHFDILLAGFPCQAFSIAGKGEGFIDTRGKLFFDIARILKIKKPQAFLLENVKGLVNHEKGNTFKTILKILTEQLNYNVFFKILNSKDFGVPQNRERIYIIGFKNHIDFDFPTPINKTVKISDILEQTRVEEKYYLSPKYLNTLKAHKARHLNKGNGFGYQIIKDNEISNTLVVGGMGKERNLIIDYNTQISNLNINKESIRKMTPREWARLQGFPDSFKLHPINTHAYKQLGNSVTVPVITAIAKNIILSLDNIDKEIKPELNLLYG